MKAACILVACMVVGSAPATGVIGQDPFDDSVTGEDPFAEAARDPFAKSNDDRKDPFAEPSSEASSRKAKRLKRRRSSGSMAGRAQRSVPSEVPHDAVTAEHRIRQTLDKLTSQAFQDTPLIEAVRIISSHHDLPIVIDARGLEEIGLSKEEPITIELQNVSLRSFLRLMLRGLDLTFVIDEMVMIITTNEAAEKNLQVQAYRLHPDLAGKADQVIKAMQSTVHASMWDIQGGPASAAVVADEVIVVSATESLHDQVQDFLTKVSAALDAD